MSQGGEALVGDARQRQAAAFQLLRDRWGERVCFEVPADDPDERVLH